MPSGDPWPYGVFTGWPNLHTTWHGTCGIHGSWQNAAGCWCPLCPLTLPTGPTREEFDALLARVATLEATHAVQPKPSPVDGVNRESKASEAKEPYGLTPGGGEVEHRVVEADEAEHRHGSADREEENGVGRPS